MAWGPGRRTSHVLLQKGIESMRPWEGLLRARPPVGVRAEVVIVAIGHGRLMERFS